jgi:hypothetical protein
MIIIDDDVVLFVPLRPALKRGIRDGLKRRRKRERGKRVRESLVAAASVTHESCAGERGWTSCGAEVPINYSSYNMITRPYQIDLSDADRRGLAPQDIVLLTYPLNIPVHRRRR